MSVAEQATERMVVGATPEQCFAIVSDVERYPGLGCRHQAGRRHPAATTRASPRGRLEGSCVRAKHQLHARVRLLRGHPGRSPGVRSAGDLTAKLDGAYTFDDAGEGRTQVTYVLEVELRVPLPGFIKRRAQSRIMHIALEDLRARVESSLTT